RAFTTNSQCRNTSERYTPPPCTGRARRVWTEKLQTNLAYSRAWHLIDVGADPRPLGRIASQIAITLMGKHKPIWDPSTDCGDYVVAVGLHDLHTTGKKRYQKKYYSHTTRPGSLKEITMDRMMEKWGGSEVLRRAVRGMLPKNRLRDDRMARLKMFEGVSHPYKQNIIKDYTRPSIAQQPEVKVAFAQQQKQQ
ncbi:ribosomal protein L13, partial [Aureobasidium pullulans]